MRVHFFSYSSASNICFAALQLRAAGYALYRTPDVGILGHRPPGYFELPAPPTSTGTALLPITTLIGGVLLSLPASLSSFISLHADSGDNIPSL